MKERGGKIITIFYELEKNLVNQSIYCVPVRSGKWINYIICYICVYICM